LRSATGDPSCVTIDGAGGRGTVLVLMDVDSTTRVEGFTIAGGSATVGGGMYCQTCDATVQSCTFTGGSATYGGGGVYVDGESYYNDMDFRGCSFSGNTAMNGAALYHIGSDVAYYTYYNGVDFVDCTFDQNSATYSGGGVFGYYCTHDFTNCTFSGNTAQNENGGGAYSQFTYYDGWDFTDCRFTDNQAANLGRGV